MYQAACSCQEDADNMTLPVAESPHKISVRKTDEAVSVFDGSANSK